jgi:two-component system sensor histidine kinase TctE
MWKPDPMRAPQSLVARVIQTVVFILVVGGIFVALATWQNGRQAARQSYDRILLGAANTIAEGLRVREGVPFVDLPVAAFELLAQAPDDRVYYSIVGPSGAVISGFGDAAVGEAAKGLRGVQYFDAGLQGEDARFVRVPRLFAEREFSGEVTVIVGQTLRARQAMAMELMLDAVLPMALAGIALLAMAWLAVRTAVRPLDAVADDLARRDPRDLTPMPLAGLPRELQIMLESLNRFMGRLDRQIDAMRNLISDTAHQLRTPVAAIRVQAETLHDEGNAPERERALERLLARTRSLGALLDQLLARALVIHRTDSAPRMALDLREIALDIVESRDHELIAPGKDVRLLIGEEAVLVEAEAFSVTEAAKNLLNNALKHGQAPIVVGVAQEGGEAWLWVLDAGAGPAADLAARLGGRFERSASSQEGSAGLGLSIVGAVATAFGGRVAFEKVESGFRAALVLPLVEENA